MSENKYPIGGDKPGEIKYGQLWARHSEVVTREDIGKYRIDFEGLKKAVEEALSLQPKPAGAVWVKAADRLPGFKIPVKWRDGDNHAHATDGKISFAEMEKPYLDGWEWLDESGAASNNDAIEFAEWIKAEGWNQRSSIDWAKYETIYSDVSVKTTADLYQLWQQSKSK